MDDFQWPTADEVAQMREGVEARLAEIRARDKAEDERRQALQREAA